MFLFRCVARVRVSFVTSPSAPYSYSRVPDASVIVIVAPVSVCCTLAIGENPSSPLVPLPVSPLIPEKSKLKAGASAVPDFVTCTLGVPVVLSTVAVADTLGVTPSVPFSILAVVVPDASVIVIVAPVSVCSTEAETKVMVQMVV